MSSPAPLPDEIHCSAVRGELQKVVKWLRKGGLVDAFCPATRENGRATASSTLLLAAAGCGHLAMVRELLKRGASVDLPTSLCWTALMEAAYRGHLSIVLVMLKHSADLDLQATNGMTALMLSADEGQQACVKALLRAKANTELLDDDGHTALQYAEAKGHTATTQLIWQHAAPPQSAAAMEAMKAEQAAEAARADAAMTKLLAEEAAEQAKAQAPSKKSMYRARLPLWPQPCDGGS